MDQNNNVPSFLPPSAPFDGLKQFLENQTKELEIKRIEVEIMQANSERQHIYMTKLLEAQGQDRKDERLHYSNRFKFGFTLSLCIVFVICFFFCFCIYMGKDQIVSELVRVVCYGGSFGFGGFYWGQSREREKNVSSQQTK